MGLISGKVLNQSRLLGGENTMMRVSSNMERPGRRATMAASTAEPPSARGPARNVVIVGASVRALAESAARSGWLVHAADLFGDTDLRHVAADAVRVAGGDATGYPLGLPAAVSRFPIAPVIYTGALENHPAIIEALARDRPLAAAGTAAVRLVRDPTSLAPLVRGVGLAYPDTTTSPVGVPVDGSFVVKPTASAGGRGVRRWRGGSRKTSTGSFLWQRLVPGSAWSVSFFAGPRGCELFAASRQLIGCRWCGGRTFGYCGSVNVPLDDVYKPLRARLESLGNSLTTHCGLIGAFGIDFILSASDNAYVIEVNPRPTASMELAERATGRPIAAAHLEACGYALPTIVAMANPSTPPRGVWSKAIVFASRTGSYRSPLPAALETLASPWTAADGIGAVADIPQPGEPLPRGGPLITVFACGATASRSLATLRHRVAEVRRLFATDPVNPPSAAARVRRTSP